jgi:ankyrin repeat protein
MSSRILRPLLIRLAALVCSLTLALGVTLAYRVYINRQAHFAEAAFMGRYSLMKFLYSLGVDVNSPGCKHRSCFTPLWGAAYGGYDDEIRFLMERGANVNGKTNWGSTALMVAAYQGHDSTVRLLLSYGADPNANWDGDTVSSLARDKGHPEIVELLRAAGARDAP